MNNRLLYHREFTFGKGPTIYLPGAAYPTVKKIFDTVHDNDAHMLTLKQEPAVAKTE